MDLTADFKSFQDLVQSSLVNVTKSAAQLSNQDLSFHRSSSEKLSRSLDRQNAHLLRLTNKLLKAATQDTPLKAPSLQSQDDIEDNWRGIVDVVDGLLEKADSALDEVAGVIKPQSPAHQDAEPSPNPARSDRGSHKFMQKPQKGFDRQVNNFDLAPFKPLLRSKPHAKVALEASIGNADSGFKHPYALEIEQYTYPASVYKSAAPIPFTPPEQSRAIFVDTEEGVKEMLEELKRASEIAIDLEHNDLRSYIGMVCLMQISTRDKDWIIDTLKPWREKLQVLNEVFADPAILKVLHGSNMDVIWLQRDLGLYLVGLFDTYHAACALQFPGKGLRHLLLEFANFHAQKQYQLADWRVRPLPDYLIDYARSDTHYLLHIYDHLRNMLIEQSGINLNLTNYVLENSKKEALQAYTRPIYDTETGGGAQGWFGMLTARSLSLNQEQLGVFRALHAWRDRKARTLDEGIQFILSNKVLWLIAESMPTSAYNFHQACRGSSKAVSDQIPELVEVVKQGKLEGKNGRLVQEILKHCEETLGVAVRRPPRRERKEPESAYQGLAATLQQLTSKGEVSVPVVNPDPSVEMGAPIATRSSSSAFWGDVPPQSQHLCTDPVTAADALSSILPLPLHTVRKDDEQMPSFTEPKHTEASKNKLLHPWQPMKPAARDQLRAKAAEIFTLKDPSNPNKKRKAEVEEGEVEQSSVIVPVHSDQASPATPSTLNPEYEAKRLTKKQKKAEKKARKEAEKAAAEAVAKETQPFDYAAAPSLLVPQAQSTARGQASGKANGNAQPGQKRMNPFAKALDTSTGARRGKMGMELAGKSMTFGS